MPRDRPDLLLRPAGATDAAAVREVRRRAWAAAPMPPQEPVEQVDGPGPQAETWVAEAPGGDGGGEVVGYARLRGAWLEDLYVDPRTQRTGVGSALLDVVRALRPEGFALWVYAQNAPARRFYAAHGLVELELTDGSEAAAGGAPGAPEVRVAWPGQDPLRFWRGAIDEVDLDLAQLLARRVALTAAVQEHKVASGGDGGHGDRDPGREQEIVQRMAAHAPGLDPGLLHRVMSTLIEESLGHWQGSTARAAAGRRADG